MATIFRSFAEGKLPQLLQRFPSGEVRSIIIDPHVEGTLYALPERGLLKSTDGGESWKLTETGLDIPLVRSLSAPLHGDLLFAGTPAGLFLSRDRGDSWETAHLTLQFSRNQRHELGGAAFIDAYWRARHHGFLSQELASQRAE
jgi:photosystem II stability/assembly factor-like uncharacterized protein